MSFQQNKGIHGMYGTFSLFTETNLVRHGFSTRYLHDGTLWDLNPRNDDPKDFKDHLKLLAEEMNLTEESLALSDQVHGDRIRRVTKTDNQSDSNELVGCKNIDGLITDQPGIALTTFYADCVPLFLLDVKNKAIGLSHAGWKGTLLEIGPKTFEAMRQTFGTKAENVLVGIGPSIGSCCFEVGQEVVEIMSQAHPEWSAYMTPGKPGKTFIDLWQINKKQFMEKGIEEKNISIAGICTKCNDSIYHSYRRDGSKAGRMAAIMVLNEKK